MKRRKRQGLPLYPGDIQQSQLCTTPTSAPTSPLTPTPPGTPVIPTFSFQSPSHSHNHSQALVPLSHTSPHPSPLPSPHSQSHSPTFASLRLFEPTTTTTSSFSFSSPFTFHRPAPMLGTPLRFKRYRATAAPASQTMPYSSTPQTSSPLLGHSVTPASSLPDINSFQFPLTFNTTLPHTIQPHQHHHHQQFESNLMGSCGSVKSELPSSQLSQMHSEIIIDNTVNSTTNHHHQRSCGLLEDLLDEAHGLTYSSGGDNSKRASSFGSREGKRVLDAFSLWESSSSFNGSSGQTKIPLNHLYPSLPFLSE